MESDACLREYLPIKSVPVTVVVRIIVFLVTSIVSVCVNVPSLASVNSTGPSSVIKMFVVGKPNGQKGPPGLAASSSRGFRDRVAEG